jgi:hypothetical protein
VRNFRCSVAGSCSDGSCSTRSRTSVCHSNSGSSRSRSPTKSVPSSQLLTEEERTVMADIVFIALTMAFFAICVLYVRGCDRIISSADDDSNVELTK